jgi:2-polyprenyl-3-methyl-5-hydroxy-6-metoxy-1,4-benzoquinol methylase
MKEEDIRKREIFNRYLDLVKEDVKTIFNKKDVYIEKTCPACDSHDHDVQFTKNGFRYVLCRVCDTLFVNPRPSFEQLTKFYTDSRSGNYWVEEFFLPVAEIRREKLFKPRALSVNREILLKKGALVGDIGAGFGIFLEELKKVSAELTLIAIEPSLKMARICEGKGLKVIPSAIEDVAGWDDKFDLLTAFELFEHLYEPGLFLEKVWRLLTPGGHLLFTTLNGEGFDIQILWERSKSVSPPHHLNFFNPLSARILLEKKGFVVESVTTPGKLDWDIIEGMRREEGVEIGRFWGNVSLKASDTAKEELQSWISGNNLSSHMKVLARKRI